MKKLGDENLVMVQEVQNLEVCTRTQYEKPGTTVSTVLYYRLFRGFESLLTPQCTVSTYKINRLFHWR